MTSSEIRRQFIDFFAQKHGHTFVPSSPVVPHDDPTLLFTNAGMNQFKPIFLGQEKRDYTRAVDTQKCIRAGGKHNDLDDVGRSRRHHTFFEMLGNWSFGDYFKRGAIEMAWELLTKVWKLDPSRLHVTCYEGNEAARIPRDTEAATLWKEIAKLPDDHIHYFGKDNFWEMGDTGPCGPCTEIYIDRTSDKTGGPQVNGDDPRVMEIWNLVFIQYNRDASGTLTPLPAQHVDTGMGFERIAQVLQAKDDNYGTDLWSPLFDAIKTLSGLQYTGQFPKTNSADPVAESANPQLRYDIAFRVVADHVRCLTFALTDGAVPSNEGRGYVLRRILRRAVRFGRQQLNLRDPFLHKLVRIVVDSMSDAFPELKKNPQRVIDLIKDEEISFGRTLDRGIQLFEEAARAGKILADEAFKLHDTYGFPIDLTRIMAEERGMSVDIAGYEKLMEQAKELARSGGKTDEGKRLTDVPPAILAELATTGVNATEDRAKYSHEPIGARILAIWNGTDLGSSPLEAGDDEQVAIVLDRTNFYAEMGGQVGDTGTLTGPTSLDLGELKRATRSVFDVESTKIVGGYILHIGRLRSGKLAAGETVTATVDTDRRSSIEKNHSATHLLNWSLRQVFGDGIQQKGSLVDAEKLRFDFSHGQALSVAELNSVQSAAATAIDSKPLQVYTKEVPQEQAMKINGLRAVFGEKYPPMVRVVSIGVPVEELLADPTNAKWREYSVEFCGGTHLARTNEAKSVCITSEESVSKGIRRIVALTGKAATDASANGSLVQRALEKLRTVPDGELAAGLADVNQQLSTLVLPLATKKQLAAEVAELQAKARAFEKANKTPAAGGARDPIAIASELFAAGVDIGGGKIIVGEIPQATDDQLRSAMDSLKKKSGSYGILLGAAQNEKVSFVAAVSDDLIAKGLKAGDWVREAAKVAGGGGGGRPQMAQAGGKDPSALPAALQAASAYARQVLGG